MNEKKTEFRGMPKLLEGVINALIARHKDKDISDEELITHSTSSNRNHRGLNQELLMLKGCAFGCRKDSYDKNLVDIKNDKKKYSSRKDDANVNSQWIANGKTYYTWNELAYEKDFENFIKEFNLLYSGKYKINCINPNEKSKSFSLSEFTEDDTDEKEGTKKMPSKKAAIQKIIFGAPGTGKSFKIDDPENGDGLNNVDKSRKFRTTFHPDYDYAQFVGAYKPKPVDAKAKKNEITYSFVPQVFAKTYTKAWEQFFSANGTLTTENQVYLVIEEINRGNCAQIFGDIFQLLDRANEGGDKDFSRYSIDVDSDFAEWLKTDSVLSENSIWTAYENRVGAGKLKLPPNFNILATMNTSDQSLFPMDSAFKRRFDWEYVPINYKHPKAHFAIEVGDKKYDWRDFLEKINDNIDKVTKSEDKKLGEFFIKPKDGRMISFEDFRSKVLFYLWDSIYKDEDGNSDAEKVFHFAIGDDKNNKMTFQKLFDKEKEFEYVKMIMGKLNVKDFSEDDNTNGAEDPAEEKNGEQPGLT